jgi:hypothetical protein
MWHGLRESFRKHNKNRKIIDGRQTPDKRLQAVEKPRAVTPQIDTAIVFQQPAL